MVTIAYENGCEDNIYPDSDVLNVSRELYKEYNTYYPKLVVYTGQALLIDAFRILVARKEIPHNNLVFRYKDQIIFIDKNGRLDNWPKGFCDVHDNFLDILLNLETENETNLST